MQTHRNASSHTQHIRVLDDDDLVVVDGAVQKPAALATGMAGPVQAMLAPFGPRRFLPWIPPASARPTDRACQRVGS